MFHKGRCHLCPRHSFQLIAIQILAVPHRHFVANCQSFAFWCPPLKGGTIPALGHKRTYAAQQGMSALPPIATAKGHVRFTPESRHVRCKRACPLWANSGHAAYSITSSAWWARVELVRRRCRPAVIY